MSLWTRLRNTVRNEELQRQIVEDLESHIAESIAQGRFFFEARGDHRDLHSFPTRRSSDLRNFTRRQVAIQNRVASNIGISQSTFSVKVLNLFSRSRRKTNKRKS